MQGPGATVPGLLDGRVALITGASRGLGLAMAEGLAEAGATVVANGRSADTLEAVARALRERGLKADTSSFDVTDQRTNGNRCHHRTLWPARHPDRQRRHQPSRGASRLDASGLGSTSCREPQALLLSRATRGHIDASAEHGRIIFTTSIAGILGLGKVHGYTASKSGLIGLTRSLASELGEYGITCNGILPGYFETDLTASYLQSDEYVARLNSGVPLRRWGKPRDLAGVAIFLSSDAASYVTGQQIVVDGGYTISL
jgi:gluconate 5-dehydrogenase